MFRSTTTSLSKQRILVGVFQSASTIASTLCLAITQSMFSPSSLSPSHTCLLIKSLGWHKLSSFGSYSLAFALGNAASLRFVGHCRSLSQTVCFTFSLSLSLSLSLSRVCDDRMLDVRMRQLMSECNVPSDEPFKRLACNFINMVFGQSSHNISLSPSLPDM
jgi:hypothetical protein